MVGLLFLLLGARGTPDLAPQQAAALPHQPTHIIHKRNEEGHSDSVAEMLMSQIFGKSASTSAPSPQSFPDSTCQTEFMDIVGGDLNDGRQAGQQAKTPKHCQKKCQDAQGCNFFAWDRMTGYCWLKRTDGLRIPHPKMIIGPKFCANMASNPHTPTPKEACSVTATQIQTNPCDLNSPYQSLTGRCNNVKNPLWGSANSPFIRLVPPQYGPDSTPRGTGQDLPGARTVTAAFPETDNPEGRIASMMMQFGQILDHDISNTLFPEKRCCVLAERPECFNIIIPSNDQTYQQRHNFSNTCIDFSRSSPACGITNREQVNQVTSFLDASMLYGSDENVAKILRAHTGGKLLENDHKPGHLPTKHQLRRPSNFIDDRMDFLAGDLRVNEQPFLTSMHVLFMREHNRLAKYLQEELETDNDELLYQSARKLFITEFQTIVYKEFLPLLLGKRFMGIYKLDIDGESVYNPNTNPTVLNEFASAAMRFGHSMINSLFKVITHEEIFLRLRDIFNAKMFNGNHMLEIEPMLLGLLNQNAQKVDGSFANEVTNHLFEEHSPKEQTRFGGDLVARNIQRARDHGIPGYNSYRKVCNLQPILSFNQKPLEINADMWARFQSLYKTVDDIDLFPAAMAENPADTDALLGPTFSCIIGLQFHNLKYGDRFFFSHHLAPLNYLAKYIKEMENRRLSDIICDNTNIVRVQVRAMESPHSGNPVRECKRPAKTQPDVEANLTDRGDISDETLDVPAAAATAPAVPAGRLENPPAPATSTTGSRNDRSSTVASEPTKQTTAESRTDRVPKSLDFFDSTDELVAPPLKFETAPAPSAFAVPQGRSSQSAAAAPRQQIVFEQVLSPKEGRSLLIGGGGNQNNKPVKFIEIFGEEDAITAP